MSDEKSEDTRRIKNYAGGDVIVGIVGDKGKVRIDKVEVVHGDKIKLIDGNEVVAEIDADDPFFDIYRQVEIQGKERPAVLKEVEQIRQEVQKWAALDESFLQIRLRNLAKMAPDIFEVTVATLANPALGFALIAQKVAKKARAEYNAQTGASAAS